ncbi:MAG TPA: hypothetical protein VHE08_04485 [Solirubrobacterales bacterium]|nr:hypothetical protein [Solirubrobacterales bacterium]
MAFLVSLVVLGLLGVPALLVAAVGAIVAAVAIAVFHRLLERTARRGGRAVPAKYVPSVLEGSSMRRRRGVHLRRHRHATPPLRFR